MTELPRVPTEHDVADVVRPFAEFRKRGLRRAGLGVDAESITAANRLYEQAGMHVAGRFDIYEKVVE